MQNNRSRGIKISRCSVCDNIFSKFGSSYFLSKFEFQVNGNSVPVLQSHAFKYSIWGIACNPVVGSIACQEFVTRENFLNSFYKYDPVATIARISLSNKTAVFEAFHVSFVDEAGMAGINEVC